MEFLVLASSSFGLGALHALEPGHGKTVVGAYLISSKGTSWHAVLLGVVVTLTHTGSVILLGILSTFAAAYFVPETVQRLLELVSGLLIVAVGGWMISVRVRQSRRAQHRHHGHGHDHNHDHAAEQNGNAGHCSHESQHGHSHAPVLQAGGSATFGQLVVLGISGGIVPCPAALAVLLLAVSMGTFVRGISLVVIFSAGMATVLVTIGLLMIRVATFAGSRMADSRWTRVLPIISAVLITLIGLGLTTKALIDAM